VLVNNSLPILSNWFSAHQRLCNAGILHRDISAGNVLLSKTNSAPFRGFITDLDFAHIKEETIQEPKVTMQPSVVRQHRHLSPQPMTRTHTIFGQKVTVKREAKITVGPLL
jgi:serine/threonine protein kinase